MTIHPDALKVMQAINKKHGADAVVRASDITRDVIPRFTTGSLSFDLALGGGWPGNQWCELVGESSNGKTAVALKTIAANQAANPDFVAVWIAAEEWVPGYAQMCGVDIDRVLVAETNVMEDAFDAALDFAASKAVDAIVIDSLPALVPGPEAEKTMDEMTVGRGALLTNKFFRKVGAVTKRSLIEEERPLLGLCINQWRQKIGVMYGSDKTTPGGQGKDYAFFARAEVKRDSWIEVGPRSEKVKVGQGIKFRTIKNKSAPPQRVGYVDFYFAEGGHVAPGDYDFAKESVALASLAGVVERKGGWYYLDDQKWQGADALLASVREDLDLRDRIDREVREAVLRGVVVVGA